MSITVCVTFSLVLVSSLAHAYEDKRCRCICPSPATVLNSSQDRKVFTEFVPPNKCNCHGVVLPHMSKEVNARAQEFCHRCVCKYETRNSTTIMVVVIIVLWVMALLAVYMIFFNCLYPLNKRHNEKHYLENHSEEARDLLTNEEADE